MRRIGIIGGSYNPIHDGHESIMEEAYNAIGLDEVWMWVSQNIFKDPAAYAPLPLRMEMCEERTKDKPWLKTTDVETVFHDTRTASSLLTVKEMFPETEFVWIFGDDNFASFHTWNDTRFEVDGQQVPDWQYIMHNFSVAIMHRPGYREEAKNSVAAEFGKDLQMDDPADLSRERTGWSFINNNTKPYSSTEIKAALMAGAANIDGLTPAAEQLIRDQGLYGLSSEFENSVGGAPNVGNNHVRFMAFPMLANTVNLVKTLSAHDTPDVDTACYKRHFEACWEKSEAKGDFQNYDDVSGELADCLISLSWIADVQGQELAYEAAGRETFDDVAQWCDTHYPNRDLQARLMDYMEELAELCVCEGMEKHRALKIIDMILEAPDLADPDEAFAANLDMMDRYAKDLGQELASILDAKMEVNRKRSVEESAVREANKRANISTNQSPEPDQ